MKTFYTQLREKIQSKLQEYDLDSCDISINDSTRMIKFLELCLFDFKEYFLKIQEITISDEITFFKEMKPQILGLLLYFNKIHNIQLKYPIGSNETQSEYYDKELKKLTLFFEQNLDFHQYYRANSTYLDEQYFVRKKFNHHLCVDSIHYILDRSFSTGYDYKVAKIICNEMLRIYLNKKKHSLEKQIVIKKNRELLSLTNLKWTGSKIDAIELGYALQSSGVINNGNIDIKEIMNFIEVNLDVDLGDYYRAYIAIKGRKKDKTPFINKLLDNLIRKIERDELD